MASTRELDVSAQFIDVSVVVDDIATHIKSQLEGILTKVSKDQLTLQENVNMILNLPIVKALLEEKKQLIKKIETLELENKELKVLIATNTKNKIKNISLEVKEIQSDTSSVTKEEIDEHIKEKEMEAIKQEVKSITSGYQMWKTQTTAIEKQAANLSGQLSRFSALEDSDDEPVYSSNDDDDDDDEEEEEDDDEEEEEDDDEEEEEVDDEEEEEVDDEEEEEEDNQDTNPQIQQLKSLTESGDINGNNDTEKQDDSEEESEEEEEELDVEDIEIDGKQYYTTDPDNGIVYECMSDGEIGDEIGRLEEGKLFLS
jgi:hypothetical protein